MSIKNKLWYYFLIVNIVLVVENNNIVVTVLYDYLSLNLYDRWKFELTDNGHTNLKTHTLYNLLLKNCKIKII